MRLTNAKRVKHEADESEGEQNQPRKKRERKELTRQDNFCFCVASVAY